MSSDFTLDNAVDMAFSVLQKSSDYSDQHTIATFMILIETIIESPKEVLSLQDPSRLTIVLGALALSGFLSSYPKYYEYSTGEVVCSVGFYLCMKQMEQGQKMRNDYLPTFVMLLHEGRTYMANIVQAALLSECGKASPYNPLFCMKLEAISRKKYAVVKGIELFIIYMCQVAWGADKYLDQCRNELEREHGNIRALIGNDFFAEAPKLYKYIEKKLMSASPYDFEN